MIKAEVHTDDYAFKVEFDATPWFEIATQEQIQKLADCGWGGDYPADDVAIAMGNYDTNVEQFWIQKENADKRQPQGFECRVDEEQAREWLTANRPHCLPTEE